MLTGLSAVASAQAMDGMMGHGIWMLIWGVVGILLVVLLVLMIVRLMRR